MKQDSARLIAARGCAAGLRDDKVTRRVLGAPEHRLADDLPAGMMLVFALGAPSRTPKLLVDSLTARFREALALGVFAADETTAVLDNRVRFRVVERGGSPAPAIGFVFSGDPALDDLVAALDSD